MVKARLPIASASASWGKVTTIPEPNFHPDAPQWLVRLMADVARLYDVTSSSVFNGRRLQSTRARDVVLHYVQFHESKPRVSQVAKWMRMTVKAVKKAMVRGKKWIEQDGRERHVKGLV